MICLLFNETLNRPACLVSQALADCDWEYVNLFAEKAWLPFMETDGSEKTEKTVDEWREVAAAVNCNY